MNLFGAGDRGAPLRPEAKDSHPVALLNHAIHLNAAVAISAVVLAASALDLVGWFVGFSTWSEVGASQPSMRPWTSLWLAGLAAAVLLQVLPQRALKFQRLARAMTIAVVLLALLVLLGYDRGHALNLNYWLIDHAFQRSTPGPSLSGVASRQAAVLVVILGVAIALLRTGSPWWDRLRLAAVCFGGFLALSIVSLSLSSSSSAEVLGESVLVSPATSIAMLLLFAAVIAARPDTAPMSWFVPRPDVASVTRAIIALVGFPVGLLTVHMLISQTGADVQMSWLVSAAFTTVMVSAGVFVASGREQRALLAQVALTATLREAKERYRLLAENMSDLVFSVSLEQTITWASPSALLVLGYTSAELIGQSATSLLAPDQLPVLERYRASLSNRLQPEVPLRLRLQSKGGWSFWAEVMWRRMRDERGDTVGLVVGVRDISGEVAAEAALQHEVAFDGLTGLARKDLALQRIRERIDERGTREWWLLCVGVNGMSEINQAYTYTAGDAVLKEVAQRLVQGAGAHDRVARIAADEFVVLRPDIVTAARAAEVAEGLLAAVRGVVSVGEAEIHVTVSIGIARPESADAEELLRDATAAMRQAGKRGKDCWEFLERSVGAQTREILQVQNELRDALSCGRIEAWFMPVVELPSRVLAGYEVLARWRREDGTIWAPDRFIEIAERTGLIIDLDRSIFRQTLSAAKLASDGLFFSYNVSAPSLASEAFPVWIREEIGSSGVDPHRLKFEITETSVFQVTDLVMATMQTLAVLGIGWWIDDFGTGFSSISHLRDLPVAGLKLDMSFTSELVEDEGHSEHLAAGLLGLARGLQLATVAEGVELAEQEAVLAGQGWAYAQGWLYGKPAPGNW